MTHILGSCEPAQGLRTGAPPSPDRLSSQPADAAHLHDTPGKLLAGSRGMEHPGWANFLPVSTSGPSCGRTARRPASPSPTSRGRPGSPSGPSGRWSRAAARSTRGTPPWTPWGSASAGRNLPGGDDARRAARDAPPPPRALAGGPRPVRRRDQADHRGPGTRGQGQALDLAGACSPCSGPGPTSRPGDGPAAFFTHAGNASVDHGWETPAGAAGGPPPRLRRGSTSTRAPRGSRGPG